MSPTVALAAPAKVNLGLRIVGRRDDGYHELESLFAPLDLADAVALRVEPAARAEVTLALDGPGEGAPADDTNLAARAARAFLERARVAARVEIGLTKRTPVAAGLGGGSSDAAAVLRGLAGALPDALDAAALADAALSLGADVPWFLDPRPAWVGGIGERREPAPGLPQLALLLANPGQPLASAEVYRAYDALESGPAPPAARPADLARLAADRGALAALLHNDLEPAARRLCPALGRLRRSLEEAGALAVGMSGSGATLFGVFPDAAAAEAAGRRLELPRPGWVRVASTRNRG